MRSRRKEQIKDTPSVNNYEQLLMDVLKNKKSTSIKDRKNENTSHLIDKKTINNEHLPLLMNIKKCVKSQNTSSSIINFSTQNSYKSKDSLVENFRHNNLLNIVEVQLSSVKEKVRSPFKKNISPGYNTKNINLTEKSFLNKSVTKAKNSLSKTKQKDDFSNKLKKSEIVKETNSNKIKEVIKNLRIKFLKKLNDNSKNISRNFSGAVEGSRGSFQFQIVP